MIVAINPNEHFWNLTLKNARPVWKSSLLGMFVVQNNKNARHVTPGFECYFLQTNAISFIPYGGLICHIRTATCGDTSLYDVINKVI